MTANRALFAAVLFLSFATIAHAGCPTPVMSQSPSLPGSNGFGLVVADLNKDGKTDYAVPDPTNATVIVYLGNGNGTFATGVPYADGGTGGGHPVAVDMNGDGFLDIALYVGNGGSAYLSVLLNHGDGTFATGVRGNTAVSTIASMLKAADMNHDGKMDLISNGSFVQIFFGAGNGTFSSVIYRYPANIVETATGADLDNDGYADLIVTTTQVSSGPSVTSLVIYRNGLNGLPLSPTTTYSAPSARDGDILPFDFNGDGFADLAVTYPDEWKVSIYGNKGDATFLAPIHYTVTTSVFNETMEGMVAADINEDGISDIVFGARNATDASMMVSNGNLTFQPAYHVPLSAPQYYLQFRDVGAADVNGDGRADILLAEYNQHSIFLVTNGCPTHFADLSVTSSVNPSTYATPVTFTATVKARDGGHASGIVTFTDGATQLGTASLSGATPPTASITVPKLSPGTHTITATYSGDATYDPSNGKVVQTVNRPAFGTPLDVQAGGSPGSSTITITWVGSTNATGYEVSRLSGGVWSSIGTVSGESINDTAVSPAQGYFYRVQAFQGETASDYSVADAATTYAFAHTVTAGAVIYAADVTDLRTTVNYLRAATGLSPSSFTDPSLAGIPIKAVHMTQLRTALTAAFGGAGIPGPAFGAPVAPGGTVLASDWNELRSLIR